MNEPVATLPVYPEVNELVVGLTVGDKGFHRSRRGSAYSTEVADLVQTLVAHYRLPPLHESDYTLLN